MFRAFAWLLTALAALCPASAGASRLIYQWIPGPDSESHGAEMSVGVDRSTPDHPALLATATGGEWNAYFVTAPGVLQGNHQYVAQLDYTIIRPTKLGSTFYMFARSETLGYAADAWTTWTGDAGAIDQAELRMTLRDVPDWRISLGMHGPGAIKVTSFKIYEGDWLKFIPAAPVSAAQSLGKAPPPSRPIPTGAGPIVIEPPHPAAELELSAADFGLKPDTLGAPGDPDIAAANGVALQAAIDAAKSRHASVLRIPPGIYRVAASQPIEFANLTDCTVDGQGAELLFTKMHVDVGPAIRVADCSRCVIKNLALDWDWSVRPLATVAQVVSVEDGGKTLVMDFPDDDDAAIKLLESTPWMRIEPIETLRPEGKPSGTSASPGDPISIDITAPHEASVSFSAPVPVTAGHTYWIRHCDYEMPAIEVSNGHNLLFDGVTIYSMPGMGWYMHGDLDHWGLRNCRIENPPGVNHPLTTAADGVHVSSSRGYFLMEGCRIGNCGDDCVNIHDNCAQGIERVDDRTLKVLITGWRIKFSAGDTIELFRGDYAPIGYVSKITDAADQGGGTVLKLADPLPAILPGDTIVWNRSYETNNVHITRCVFHDNTVRGVLMAAKNVTIDQCIFDHTAFDGFQLHTELDPPHWWEGHGASNLVFTHNLIRNVNLLGHNGGPAIFGVPSLPGGPPSVPLFNDILISNNEIVNCLGPAIRLGSCSNVTISNNSVENNMKQDAASPVAGVITLDRASGVAVTGNRWSGAFCMEPGVSYDTQNCTRIAAGHNGIIK